jgi:hypothetical protein
MSALFELEEFTETEWQIVRDWGRCGLCGVKCAYNQGGTHTGGVCDECARIDRCRGSVVAGDDRHFSHWGMPHEADEHDQLVRGQARRRARFLKAVTS